LVPRTSTPRTAGPAPKYSGSPSTGEAEVHRSVRREQRRDHEPRSSTTSTSSMGSRVLGHSLRRSITDAFRHEGPKAAALLRGRFVGGSPPLSRTSTRTESMRFDQLVPLANDQASLDHPVPSRGRLRRGVKDNADVRAFPGVHLDGAAVDLGSRRCVTSPEQEGLRRRPTRSNPRPGGEQAARHGRIRFSCSRRPTCFGRVRRHVGVFALQDVDPKSTGKPSRTSVPRFQKKISKPVLGIDAWTRRSTVPVTPVHRRTNDNAARVHQEVNQTSQKRQLGQRANERTHTGRVQCARQAARRGALIAVARWPVTGRF